MDTSWNQEEIGFPQYNNENQSKPKKGSPLRLVQRYALLISGMVVFTTSGAYLFAMSRGNYYEGFFQLLVEPVSAEAQLSEPTALARGGNQIRGESLDYATQISILRSPRILRPVIQEVQKTYSGFNFVRLQQNLTLERSNGTRMIQVNYEGSDPELVQLVLNELAQKYLSYSLEERKTRIGEGINFIEEQLPRLRERAEELQNELETLQQDNSFLNPEAEGQAIANRVRQLTQQIDETQRQLEEQQTSYQNLSQQLGLTPQQALASSTLSQDPVYQSLMQRIKEIEQQIAQQSATFTEESPNIQSLQQQREQLLPLLRERAAEIVGSNSQQEVNPENLPAFPTETRIELGQQLISSANSIEQLKTRERVLTNRRSSLENELDKFPPLARRYAEIRRELDNVNKTLNQLLSQRETLRVEAAQTQVPWELVYQPQIPRQPDGTPAPVERSWLKYLGAGIVGGLILGIGLAYLIDQHLGVFKESEDITYEVELPLLEEIPTADDTSTLPQDVEAEIDHSSALTAVNPFFEAFNALYAKLWFLYPDSNLKSVVISSPSAGDGKSTVALHLAGAIAATDKKVLLVDANFRSPQLHQELNLPNEKGLKQLLKSPRETKNQRLIQNVSNQENLFVLTSGGTGVDVAQLLASEQMKQLMEKFEQTFDLVIYDTPQLEGYTDAKFMIPNSNGLLLVVQLNQTKRKIIQSAIAELESFNIKTLGIIPNEGGKGTSLGQPLASALNSSD